MSGGPRAGHTVMEALTAPQTLRQAALAGALTTAACVPRLLGWNQSPYPVWFSAITIALTSSVMWAFVLAWEPTRLGRAPQGWSPARGLWLAATGFALVAAAFRCLVLDPALVANGLAQSPTSGAEWLATGLFQLAFLQLFLLFAPVALCTRLFSDRRVAISLTVSLGLYVSWRNLTHSDADPSPWLIAQILLTRALGDGLAVWFYQRGGVFVAWWIALVLHLRHLVLLHTPG